MVTALLVAELVAGFGFCVSVTVTVNFNVSPALGAVNVGCCALLFESDTAVPAFCVLIYVSLLPSACDDPEASSCTGSAVFTDWFDPELAVGVAYSLTVIVTALLVAE